MESLSKTLQTLSSPLPEEVLRTPLWTDRIQSETKRCDISSLNQPVTGFKIIRNRDKRATIPSKLDWQECVACFDEIKHEGAKASSDAQIRVAEQGILIIQARLDQMLVNFHGESVNYAIGFEQQNKIVVSGDPMLTAYLGNKIQLDRQLKTWLHQLRAISISAYTSELAANKLHVNDSISFGYEVILGYGFVKLWNGPVSLIN